MRPQTPVPHSADDFLPTKKHQLTPYASPMAEKRCVELDASAFLCPLGNENSSRSSTFMTIESPIRCYMPRRVSHNGATSTTSCLDGDVTPPLHSNPTIQVVSPSALPLELTDERRYQGSSYVKRMRAAEARGEPLSKKRAKTTGMSPSTVACLLSQSFPMEPPVLPELSGNLEDSSSKRISRSPSHQELKERSIVMESGNIPFLPDLSIP